MGEEKWMQGRREVASLRNRTDTAALAGLQQLLESDDLLVCIDAAEALLDRWHATGLRVVLQTAAQADAQLRSALWGVVHEYAEALPGEIDHWLSELSALGDKRLSAALDEYVAAPW